jgi:hypothetical protein
MTQNRPNCCVNAVSASQRGTLRTFVGVYPTVTDLLEQNVPLEDVQHLDGHADPRTTRLYVRRRRKVTRNIVERISSNTLSGKFMPFD